MNLFNLNLYYSFSLLQARQALMLTLFAHVTFGQYLPKFFVVLLKQISLINLGRAIWLCALSHR